MIFVAARCTTSWNTAACISSNFCHKGKKSMVLSVRFHASNLADLLPARLAESSVQDWWISREICSVLDDVDTLASHSNLWLLEDCPRPSVCSAVSTSVPACICCSASWNTPLSLDTYNDLILHTVTLQTFQVNRGMMYPGHARASANDAEQRLCDNS